jgi:hypothetical protein
MSIFASKDRAAMPLVSSLMFMASFAILVYDQTIRVPRADKQTSSFFKSTDYIYGLVHVAKTAGSSINGNLSMHYERICGNKGYSYDAFQTNQRFQKSGGVIQYSGDSYAELYRKHNRGRVPPQLMDEIGYESCDWISVERKWKFWPETFHNWSIPVELHVPCRSPVDHLMSQCNHKHIKFDCSQSHEAILQQIDDCLISPNRYNHKLESTFVVKCFDYNKTNDYLTWIGSILQRRRIEANYAFRQTNLPRDKENECVWTQPRVLQVIEEYLRSNVEYYSFCHDCIGSERDLFSLN